VQDRLLPKPGQLDRSLPKPGECAAGSENSSHKTITAFRSGVQESRSGSILICLANGSRHDPKVRDEVGSHRLMHWSSHYPMGRGALERAPCRDGENGPQASRASRRMAVIAYQPAAQLRSLGDWLAWL